MWQVIYKIHTQKCVPLFRFLNDVKIITCPPKWSFLFVVFQLLNHIRLFAAWRTAACQVFVFFTISEFAQTHVHCVNDAIQIFHPLSPSSPFALSLSQHQGFSYELALRITWPKYWNVSFSVSPSSEYSGLISFRIDSFDLLAVQETLKSLLQPQNSKELILQWSAFLLVQLSHPYMTTG